MNINLNIIKKIIKLQDKKDEKTQKEITTTENETKKNQNQLKKENSKKNVKQAIKL